MLFKSEPLITGKFTVWASPCTIPNEVSNSNPKTSENLRFVDNKIPVVKTLAEIANSNDDVVVKNKPATAPMDIPRTKEIGPVAGFLNAKTLQNPTNKITKK